MSNLKNYVKNYNSMNKNELYNFLRNIISYNNMTIDDRIFFSSTATYNIKNNNNLDIKEQFALRLFIPDFIIENYPLCTREQKLLIINFIKIFLKEIIFLNNYVDIDNNLYLYTSSIKNYKENDNIFNCKRDIMLFFSRFFKKKIKIYKNYSKKIENKKQFSLGKNYIYSKIENNKKYFIGNEIYSFLSRYLVQVEVHYSEMENLQRFLKSIKNKQEYIIFSSTNKKIDLYYKFNFIFEENKCIQVFSEPNINFNN